ncbi:MAG: DDE-type integrase/transposase/recombinase, partial [Nitrospirota bacterium]
MTVSKTYANDVIRKHRYEIQILRKKIKNRKPRGAPKNLVWGMDLTGKTAIQGNLIHILGIVEHKSRQSLSLSTLKNKASVTILRTLLDVIEHYGKPRFLRTDNESIFTSLRFRFGVWLMGIRHQRIEKSCPWQNGRIE